jgi:branched-chain amino acid transport system ATP-binding protein
MNAVDTILEVEHLSAWYGAAQVLFDVTLRVGRGEAVALMGRNGAGKSTTMKSVMALIPRRGGTVRFCGRDISRLQPYQIARLGLGYVPEDRRVFYDLTVAENLDVGRQPARSFPDGRPAPSWTEAKLYALFPNLAAMAGRRGRQMSGGEQQMLAVARTLVQNPDLILMDEPSEGLSPRLVEEIGAIIQRLHAEGVAILLVEQNLNFALGVAQRVLIMNKGAILYAGRPQEIAANEQVLHQDLGVGAAAVAVQ